MGKTMQLDGFIGRTLTSITCEPGGKEMFFKFDDGHDYKMYHPQFLCETVFLHGFVGDLNNLIGTPIISAEKMDTDDIHREDSVHPVFSYRLRTAMGAVDFNWVRGDVQPVI
jgi:hypothetical protein